MDFKSDRLSDGRQLRALSVVDVYTCECVVLEAATSFRGEDVARALTRAIVERGARPPSSATTTPAALRAGLETNEEGVEGPKRWPSG